MTWWAWALVWTVLVAGSSAVLFLLGRKAWRSLRALTRELGAVTERLGVVTDRLADRQADREVAKESVGAAQTAYDH